MDIVQEKYPIHFYNNVYFKHLLDGNDKDSEFIRKHIIERVLDTNLRKAEIIESKLIEDSLGYKALIDVKIYDYDYQPAFVQFQIEGWHELLHRRMDAHFSTFFCDHFFDYPDVPQFYSIVFITDEPKDDRLLNYYRIANEENIKLIGNLINYHYVYPKSKHILEFAKERGLANLPSFESLCYILANNPLDDLLKENKKHIIEIMMNKYQEMITDNKLLSLALKAEILELLLPNKLKEFDQEKEDSND